MTTQQDLLKLEEEMNKKYINRSAEIRGLLVTMLARGNMVLLGQAGTAKTDMVQTLARSIKSDCFETILTRTSSPEELFGAYDIKELEQGRYVRNTEHTLATAEFGFVDEVFKCNSAVLNGLLGVMAQRTFRNGNSMPTPIPLQLLVGASNELPEGGADGELSALWDRFEMRFVVDYIKDERSFLRLLSMGKSLEPKTLVQMCDVINAQSEAKDIPITNVEQVIIGIWKRLKEEGLAVSDRKWRNSLKYLRANAWLEGRTNVEEDDVEILKNVLWQAPEQIKTVRKVVGEFANPDNNKAQELGDISEELLSELKGFTDNDTENRDKFGTTKALKASEVHSKLVRTRKQLNTMKTKVKSNGKSTKAIDTIIDKVNNEILEVTKVLTGDC